MSTKSRAADIGDARARIAVAKVVEDVRQARIAAGLAQADVARASGISRSQYGRIERGQSPALSIRAASRLCSVVGLDLSVRTYPAGDPIRDAAQIALLAKIRERCHPMLVWRTEVPLALTGDRRAWDATISGPTWTVGVEAETGLSDVQALERRLALKQRDGDLGEVLLVVLDSRRDRAVLRIAGHVLLGRFPMPAELALTRLANGEAPGGSALVLL
jgi:transcriptional regulator with XRE-family HTH domain